MDTAQGFLAQLLQKEVNISTLLGFVAARDPAPLQRYLRLAEAVDFVRTEVPNGRGRMDVVLYRQGRIPLAVIELKLAAGEHGDQLSIYRRFAAPHDAVCFIADMEAPDSSAREGWRHIRLDDLFGAWARSSDEQARVFSGAIRDVLQGWRETTTGVIGKMPTVMYRQMVRSMARSLTRGKDRSHAGTTANGQASLTTYRPHPAVPEGAFLCVDLRHQSKQDSTAPWLLRLGVHVDETDDRVADRKLAHNLAMGLVPFLTLEHVHTALRAQRLPEGLVRSVQGANPLHTPAHQSERIAAWLAAVERAQDGSAPRNHPLFYNDWGRRLVGQLKVQVVEMTLDELTLLVGSSLDALTLASQSARLTMDTTRTGPPAVKLG